MAKEKVSNRFFAKFAAGGLILRLLVVTCAILFGLVVALSGLAMAGVPIDWWSHGIAFGLLVAAFCSAHVVECLRVEPEFGTVRLMASTVLRVGIPLIGIVLLDRLVRPGFLTATLAFWLIGFLIGLLVSLLLTVKRISHDA